MSSDWDDVGELDDARVASLKAAYGPIFSTTIDGSVYCFKTLTRAEAVSLGLIDGYIGAKEEEDIVQAALVWPDIELDFDTMSAGHPSVIAREILARSGIRGSSWLNEYMQRARDHQTAYHTIAATVCAAFSGIMPGELDELDVQKLCDLVVQAEEILSIRAMVNAGSYIPLTFVDEDEQAGPTEMTKEEKDAMVRAMLEGSMPDVPAGIVDRSKKLPPGANPYELRDDDL